MQSFKSVALTCFLAIVLFRELPAQNDRIRQLESSLQSVSGAQRAQVLVQLADANIDAGNFSRAEDWADEAYDIGKRLKSAQIRAEALNRQGKALFKADKKGIFGKEKAGPKFLQSVEILRSTGANGGPLLVDNLEYLKLLAVKAGRTDDAQRLELALQAAKSGVAPPEPSAPSDPPSAATELENEKLKLLKKIAGQVKGESETNRRQEELLAKLSEKEAQIGKMTENQVKTQLLLLEQRQMLDSFTFRSSLDSINLINKELTIKEARAGRNFSFAVTGALLLLLGGVLFGFFKTRDFARQIQIEKNRSDELLLNILPALVAGELKKNGYTAPRHHENVAVLFADFVGFSKIAEQLPPDELVRELDVCFKAFDDILQVHHIEKIKTIGDCYMCASGLNQNGKAEVSPVVPMVEAAQAMQQWLNYWNLDRVAKNKPRFEARIGIHNGPVVAGVVGSKKFAFDIWGDTVNTAARVEQASEPGKINLSGKAFEAVKNRFKGNYRGKIDTKNKGEIEMYFIDSFA